MTQVKMSMTITFEANATEEEMSKALIEALNAQTWEFTRTDGDVPVFLIDVDFHAE